MKTILYQDNQWDLVAEALKEGKIIAFPTDTVFGLACLCDNPQAIQKVKEAKMRDAAKPLPMMCSDKEMMKKYVYLTENAEKLVDNLSPGKLTIVLDKKNSVPDYVSNSFPSLAIRIPNVEHILYLIRQLGKPLLVTSANLSGEPSLASWRAVLKSLEGRIDGLVCSDAASDTASTIVDARNQVTILRLGEISEKKIKEIIK